jgi:RNA polymerase sigma factor (sigma-70 family)
MARLLSHPRQAETTHRLIDQLLRSEAAAGLRRQLASGYPDATDDQIEEAIQEACASATHQWRGTTIRELRAWLAVVAGHALADLYRHRRRELPAYDVLEVGAAVGGWRAPDPQQAVVDQEDEAEVEAVARAILTRLSDRQRQITALHAHGRKRPQIAARLGMTDRTVKRQLERIFAVGREELVNLAGAGCEPGRHSVARLAFRLASPRQAREAQLHLLDCRDCAALYQRLEEWREKVAALLPAPAASHINSGSLERAAHHAAEALAAGKREVTEMVSAFRQNASALPAQAKQHATSTYYRAIDPTPLAGARPGAAAAVVASCLAIGGGAATYCLKQGVPGFPSFSGDSAAETHKKPRAPRAHRAETELPSPPIVTTPAETAPQEKPTATDPTPKASAPPPPPPAPGDEFEAQRPVAASASAAPPPKPAPAPSSGPSEFQP